jgi:hypothetical protein
LILLVEQIVVLRLPGLVDFTRLISRFESLLQAVLYLLSLRFSVVIRRLEARKVKACREKSPQLRKLCSQRGKTVSVALDLRGVSE